MTAPYQDPIRRRAGVCLHPTSLPGPRGIGELGRAAHAFLDWMQEHRLSVWQFLPLGPTGFGDSPYQPLSVFAGNPLLIDLEQLAAWGLLERDEIPIATGERQDFVDYGSAACAKSLPLSLACGRLLTGSDRTLSDEFETFCARHDEVWLDDYASFAVLRQLNPGQAWREWPSAGIRRSEVRARLANEYRHPWRSVKCGQFLFARQWAALREAARARGILLFGDVPIYLAADCSEAWSRPELLDLDQNFEPVRVAGVPPDYFSADGQLWGNPLYRWQAHAEDGFIWWLSRLRHALAFADLVRLDHFRGFEAYWSIPRSAPTAREGRWEPGPGTALFDAVLQAFGRAPFVAEDLGVITDAVIALRKAYAMPGMQVLQFLVDQDDFDADAIDEDCVCYTGTHDNDTVEGWFAGSAGHITGPALASLQQAVRRNVEGARDSVHRSMISLCFSTKARLAIAPLQDYLGLGSASRLNTPGTARGNWRWRVAPEQLEREDLAYIGAEVTRQERT